MKNIATDSTEHSKKGLGLIGLAAIAFSSMVGGGIFNIAQNMASTAGLGAVAIAWIITGIGMIFLVLSFKILNDKCPDLNQGIYEYAREGFGNYMGFNIAWGYWLCVILGNVAFAVMLNDAMGAFFPVFLTHSWPTLIFCIALVWIMYVIVIIGETTASFINTVMTILKFSAIIIIITILIFYFQFEQFTADIWGDNYSMTIKPLGGLHNQIMGTMLVTMFCFVGVEGALMMSSHAKKQSDVGKASVLGFYLALIIYALISILCYGVRSQSELAVMHDPSIAYVLKDVCGQWAYYFVISTVILSLLSAFIAWTLLCAQTPYGAATVHIFPKLFLRTNRHDVPVHGLTIATIFMSLFVGLVCTAPDVYMAALNLTTIMVLPAYAITGAFLWKITYRPKHYNADISIGNVLKYRIIGILCTIYCIWCILAGGFLLFLASSILYIPGFYFFYKTHKENEIRLGSSYKLLTNQEKIIFIILICVAVLSIILISTGEIQLS